MSPETTCIDYMAWDIYTPITYSGYSGKKFELETPQTKLHFSPITNIGDVESFSLLPLQGTIFGMAA